MPRRKTSPFACLTIAFLWSSVVVAQETVKQTTDIHGTLISAENDSFMLRGVMILHDPNMAGKEGAWTPSAGKTKVVDAVGTFDINGVRPGHYFFSPEGPQAAVTYFKKVECDGQDYSARPLEIEAGDLAINCKLTFARDSGTITGQVLHGRSPVHAFQVFAIPEAKELRSVFGQWASSFPTKRNGRFEMRGVIPGDYFVFAVPADSAKGSILRVFDDRTYASAQYLTIRPHETTTITLQATSPKP